MLAKADKPRDATERVADSPSETVPIEHLPRALRAMVRLYASRRTGPRIHGRADVVDDEQWNVIDEVKRQDDIAKSVLPVSLAGAAAAATLAATPGAGDYRVLLFVVALILTVPALLAVLVMASVPYARNEESSSARSVLDDKISLNKLTLGTLWLGVFGAVVGALAIAYLG